jgi:acyl transferase domain-containing protein
MQPRTGMKVVSRKYRHHAILAERIPERTSFDPCWRVVLSLDDESWLGDHRVQQDVIFPLAGYVAMAGEAIRQIAGIEAGCGMRHVVVHRAIVLGDSKPVKIGTTLRRHKLTDSIDSDFHDFVISSYFGSVWIKNCEGLRSRVKANGNFITTTTSSETLPRHVPVSRWYETLSRVGRYGPEFQGLTRIPSSTTDCLAAGCSESLEFAGRAIFIPSCSCGRLLSAWHCGHGKRRRL